MWLWHIGSFFNQYSPAISALAGAAVAGFTFVLVRVNRDLWAVAGRQADIAEGALIKIERAFVFPQEVVAKSHWNPDNGRVWWSFEVKWRNSGKTTTRDLNIWTSQYLESQRMPSNFSFDGGKGRTIPTMVGPGAVISGDALYADGSDLAECQRDNKHFYIWGWAEYRDIFEGTPVHITRFCYKIRLLGDPTKVASEANVVDFIYAHHPRHNCADDDCEKQDINPRFRTI